MMEDGKDLSWGKNYGAACNGWGWAKHWVRPAIDETLNGWESWPAFTSSGGICLILEKIGENGWCEERTVELKFVPR
jgi:hypothetical protein